MGREPCGWARPLAGPGPWLGLVGPARKGASGELMMMGSADGRWAVWRRKKRRSARPARGRGPGGRRRGKPPSRRPSLVWPGLAPRRRFAAPWPALLGSASLCLPLPAAVGRRGRYSGSPRSHSVLTFRRGVFIYYLLPSASRLAAQRKGNAASKEGRAAKESTHRELRTDDRGLA